MDLDLSPWRFPIEWAEDVIAAAACQTNVILRHHISEQDAGIDGVTLGYGYASDLIAAVAERIEDPELREGILLHIKHGIRQALKEEIDADGLRANVMVYRFDE